MTNVFICNDPGFYSSNLLKSNQRECTSVRLELNHSFLPGISYFLPSEAQRLWINISRALELLVLKTAPITSEFGPDWESSETLLSTSLVRPTFSSQLSLFRKIALILDSVSYMT